MSLYRILRFIAKGVFKLIYRIEVKGIENIPKDEGALICPNHYTWADPVMVAITTPRPIRFMAKFEAFQNPFLRFLLKNLGAFPVRRGEPDLNAIKTALKLLKDENLLGLFPQGTRVKGDDLGKAHSGVALLSIKSNKKVIPVYIGGNYVPFTKMRVFFGEPIDFSAYTKDKLTGEDYLRLSQIVMEKIKELKEGGINDGNSSC
ncbi:lysophospholipid acyltransferase family protein [Caloramator australicus]|uniref:1-acyl-sn-glycerol-3-phosphate acyltransferase n=2 Tax=Caloramator TaxID=44258 RepID=I7K709_9CLOT|nr:lysophospholipid acyltransferase family protein [Caloramator australicus]CCJ33324.1 1-acyl-sn-glycerol-3-phosphate acyltransferase [Caloramator australicus RC3]